MPRVSRIDYDKRQGTASSGASGTFGQEIEVQVEEDEVSALKFDGEDDQNLDNVRKSELERAITKVLNMKPQPYNVQDVVRLHSPNAVASADLPTSIRSPVISSPMTLPYNQTETS